jgi:hypothetical protein
VNYTLQYWQLYQGVYDQLVTFARVGGQASNNIVPDLATAMPAVTDGGMTFDPATGSVNVAGVVLVDHAGGLQSVSCLTTRAQCTAVDLTGHQVTFDPATGAVIGSASVDGAAARI